jgi:hypothetical protein
MRQATERIGRRDNPSFLWARCPCTLIKSQHPSRTILCHLHLPPPPGFSDSGPS